MASLPSYLRPHLYPDLLEEFKKVVPPQALCNFALSSSHAYATAARYITTPCKTFELSSLQRFVNENNFPGCILYQTMTNLVFVFSEKFHIRALLHLSGKHCGHMFYKCPSKVPWNASFYEGLAENQCLESIRETVGRSFVEAYVSKRDTVDTVFLQRYHNEFTDLLEGKIIKNLYTTWDSIDIDSDDEDFDVNAIQEVNVECLILDNEDEVIDQLTFAGYRASFTTLKTVKFSEYMFVRTALLNLEKLRNVENVKFEQVALKDRPIATPQKVLRSIICGMKYLWDAMLMFPGNIEITFYPYIMANFTAKAVADIFREHRGFKVKEDRYTVEMGLKVTADGETRKVLNVEALYGIFADDVM